MEANIAIDDVSQLLAHEEPAILIDRVIFYGDYGLEALVKHDKKSLYNDDQGNVPIWVGLEYMAQAVNAFAGIQSIQENKPIRIGLLLGTRQYKVFTDQFRKNCPVIIQVKEVFRDETNLVLFDCEIRDSRADSILATAQIKAIMPDNIEEILGEL